MENSFYKDIGPEAGGRERSRSEAGLINMNLSPWNLQKNEIEKQCEEGMVVKHKLINADSTPEPDPVLNLKFSRLRLGMNATPDQLMEQAVTGRTGSKRAPSNSPSNTDGPRRKLSIKRDGSPGLRPPLNYVSIGRRN